jgi:hypothetical protein
VESGGKVTIRAVSPACLQPYQWESKTDWYDASKHSANFLLLDNVPGYFSRFNPAPGALLLLNRYYGKPKFDDTGTYRIVRGNKAFQYEARVYSGNLLAALPRLQTTLPNPPPWLVKNLLSQGSKVPRGADVCS